MTLLGQFALWIGLIAALCGFGIAFLSRWQHTVSGEALAIDLGHAPLSSGVGWIKHLRPSLPRSAL